MAPLLALVASFLASYLATVGLVVEYKNFKNPKSPRTVAIHKTRSVSWPLH